MSSTTLARAAGLAIQQLKINGVEFGAVPNFAVFIDTHRDQPHVGSFENDIHRGECKPTLVHLMPLTTSPAGLQDWALLRASDGRTLVLHEKHRFIDVEWWGDFLARAIADTGSLPLDSNGMLPTSHLRDARAKKYLLKSFRQMVVSRQRTTP